MVFKRFFEGEGVAGLGASGQISKRRLASSFLRNVAFSPEDVNKLEPFVRRVVREEVDRLITIFLGSSARSLNDPFATSGVAGLKLQFVNNFPSPVFTGNRIQTADDSPIAIELVDASTNCRVTTGPLSSLKLEILVLDGDFPSDDCEDWTEKEFSDKILREREGRRPLVTGELTVTLRGGVGYLGSIVFTDNSSWIRSRKFRLGARTSPKCTVGQRVREASSQTFIVKDHRGKLYEKHHPPYLKDEVWRLEHIAKDGVFRSRLASNRICSVKDLLRLYETNPSQLKKILSGDGAEISNRTWESIIGHATKCVIDDDQMFVYFNELMNAGLLFNSVYRVAGATFDGRNYCPIEKLTGRETILVQNLKKQAYENVHEFKPISGPLALGPPGDLTCSSMVTFLTQQDPSEALQEFDSLSASTSYGYEAPGSQMPEVSGPQGYNPMDVLTPIVTSSFTMVSDMWPKFLSGENFDAGSSSHSEGPIVLNEYFPDTQSVSQFHISTGYPSTSVWTPGNVNGFIGESEFGNSTSLPSNFSFYMGPGNEAGPSFSVHIPRNTSARAGWCKIRAAFKWKSIRRDLAARRELTARRQQVFCL